MPRCSRRISKCSVHAGGLNACPLTCVERPQCKKNAVQDSLYCGCHQPADAAITSEECSVCFEQIFKGQRNIVKLHCAPNQPPHKYHEKCLQGWLTQNKDTCPLCRAEIDTRVIYKLDPLRDQRLLALRRAQEALEASRVPVYLNVPDVVSISFMGPPGMTEAQVVTAMVQSGIARLRELGIFTTDVLQVS